VGLEEASERQDPPMAHLQGFQEGGRRRRTQTFTTVSVGGAR
jgi:hypothetical protein